MVLVDGRLTGKPTPMKVKRAAPGGEGLVLDPYSTDALDSYLDRFTRALAPLPADCTRQVIRPDPDTAIAQNKSTLTEAFFNDPAGTTLSKIFATKLELDCQAKG